QAVQHRNSLRIFADRRAAYRHIRTNLRGAFTRLLWVTSDYALDSIASDGIFFYKATQLRFRNGEFSETTIQANCELWKYPHNWPGQAAEAREMNRKFSEKPALIFRLARLTDHFGGLSRYLWTSCAHCLLLTQPRIVMLVAANLEGYCL